MYSITFQHCNKSKVKINGKDTKNINTQVNYSRSLLLLLLPLLPISVCMNLVYFLFCFWQAEASVEVNPSHSLWCLYVLWWFSDEPSYWRCGSNRTWDHMTFTCQPTPASRRKRSEPSPLRRTAPGWLEKRLHAHKNKRMTPSVFISPDMMNTVETSEDPRHWGIREDLIHWSFTDLQIGKVNDARWTWSWSCDSWRRLVVSGWFSVA